jgi:flagellar protein FlaG
MSIISPVSGQSGPIQGSSSTRPASDSVTEVAKVPAKSESSNGTTVANENAQLTVQEVEETVASLNQAMKLLERGINFEVDEGSERTIIKVVDRETMDVIKQIPSEDLLKVIEHMHEMQNILFDGMA